jgi:SRSO17 transposase
MEHTDTDVWLDAFVRMTDRIGKHLGRAELRNNAASYLRGLIGSVERKNSWQIAEALGYLTPHAIQRLLSRASWQADAVRDELRIYVIDRIGDENGILIVDETGFLKKGDKSAGVARQYSGTAGRVENCQIGVFLAYRSDRGTAFIDRRLYLPESWIDAPERRKDAGIPEEAGFATKPELARDMIRNAINARIPCRWVVVDEVYGGDSKFREFLELQELGYVAAVPSNRKFMLGGRFETVREHAAGLGEADWSRLSCGKGSKGERLYDWAFIPFRTGKKAKFSRGLLVRRSITDPSDRAFYLCHFRLGTLVEELVRVAGSRWSIETAFEQAKQGVGLADYEVRTWTGWHRHVTLSMFAYAFVESVRVMESKPETSKTKPETSKTKPETPKTKPETPKTKPENSEKVDRSTVEPPKKSSDRKRRSSLGRSSI